MSGEYWISYGIRYKAYECMLTYSGNFGRKHEDTWSVQRAAGYGRKFVEYTRYEVVITDYKVAVKAVELLDNPKEAKTIFARHVDIVRNVFLNLPSISTRVLDYFYTRGLSPSLTAHDPSNRAISAIT